MGESFPFEEAHNYIHILNENCAISNNMIRKIFDFPPNWYQSFRNNTKSQAHRERADIIYEHFTHPEKLINKIIKEINEEIEDAIEEFTEKKDDRSEKTLKNTSKENLNKYESINNLVQSTAKIVLYCTEEIHQDCIKLTETFEQDCKNKDFTQTSHIADRILQAGQIRSLQKALTDLYNSEVYIRFMHLQLAYPNNIMPLNMRTNPVLGPEIEIPESTWSRCFEEKIGFEHYLSLNWKDKRELEKELFSTTCKRCKLNVKKACKAYLSKKENENVQDKYAKGNENKNSKYD